MSTLVLVRHGQAMPFTDDPDRLSAIGEQQAADLGRWWARQGISFDQVISGTMERQVRTAQIAGAVVREAGLPWPDAESIPSWNEFDAEGVVKHVVPVLAESDATFGALVTAFEAHRNSPDQNRHFQRMLQAVMSRWGVDEAAVDGVERGSAFHARISGALRSIIDGDATNRRILVVTSGGPIGVVVQTILDAPAKAALALTWRIRNCSVTEVVFTRDRASIDSFNLTTHISRPDLITFR